MSEHESRKRSLMKSITWRILATITTFILVIALSGDLGVALGVSFFELVLKFFIYYGHERMWDYSGWGKVKTEG